MTVAPTDREFDMLIKQLERMTDRLDQHGKALDDIMGKLSKAEGGMNVGRWLLGFFGFGTLGGILALAAQVGGWLRGH